MPVSTPTTSIALCTYNGQSFLPEQLDSILAQTSRPHEMVVCDDASSDSTLLILERFAAAAPFPVRLVRNPSTLGSTRNFAQAIALCTSDVVLLCDQDDAWEPSKISVMLDHFTREPALGMVFSDGSITAGGARSGGEDRLWQAAGFAARDQARVSAGAGLEVLLRYNVVTGAAMGFRRRYADLILPIDPGWVQDAWIALLLAAVAPCAAEPGLLIRYRRHAAQQVGVGRGALSDQLARSRRLRSEDFLATARQYQAAADRLLAWPGQPLHQPAVELVRAKALHFETRAHLQSTRGAGLKLVAKEWRAGRYRSYSLGFKSAIRDVIGAFGR